MPNIDLPAWPPVWVGQVFLVDGRLWLVERVHFDNGRWEARLGHVCPTCEEPSVAEMDLEREIPRPWAFLPESIASYSTVNCACGNVLCSECGGKLIARNPGGHMACLACGREVAA